MSGASICATARLIFRAYRPRLARSEGPLAAAMTFPRGGVVHVVGIKVQVGRYAAPKCPIYVPKVTRFEIVGVTLFRQRTQIILSFVQLPCYNFLLVEATGWLS